MPTRELLAPSQRAQFIELPSSFDEQVIAVSKGYQRSGLEAAGAF
jgi:hypothetical protein